MNPYSLAIAVLSLTVGRPGPPLSQDIVMLGPPGPIEAQLQYLVSTWPQQHAVAVIEAAEAPRCSTSADDSVGTSSTMYCWLRARTVEYWLVNWFNSSPPGPAATFTLHYWYRTSPSEFVIRSGTKLIALLAPTHASHVFSATVLRSASDANVRATQNALHALHRRGA
jgi:hypothetical protein